MGNGGIGIRQRLFATMALAVVVAVFVQGQEPQPVHEFLSNCVEGPPYCDSFMDFYCTHQDGICVPCPTSIKDGAGVTEEDCRLAAMVRQEEDNTTNTTVLQQLDLENCIAKCVRPQQGDNCSTANECDEEEFFCNFDYNDASSDESRDDGDSADESTSSDEIDEEKYGTCSPCKKDPTDCLKDDSIHSIFGKEECVMCDTSHSCIPFHLSVVTEEEHNNNNNTRVVVLPSNALRDSPSAVVRGPLVDCTNLIYDGRTTCSSSISQQQQSVMISDESHVEDHHYSSSIVLEETENNNNNVIVEESFICLVHDVTRNTLFVDVVHKCAALGGMGVVFYGSREREDGSGTSDDEPWVGNLSFDKNTTIPSVVVAFHDGERLQRELENSNLRPPILQLNVTRVGEGCWKEQVCSDEIPCMGTNQQRYCSYKWSGNTKGWCNDCPQDEEGNLNPLGCFFSMDMWGEVTGQNAVEDCARVCASRLKFPQCKFCPREVSGFEFMNQYDRQEGETRCEFCPNDDVQYPEKDFPLFGEGIKCWQVQKFFKTVDIEAESVNCRLARMMNHVCGCAGNGYAGASTEAKRAVLAWLPRVMAILSVLGSSYIIYDVVKQDQRQKGMNHLLVALSVFDILGSTAYAFTTLPIPENDPYGPIYGAHGTEATCTTQAFFIQVGTISAYINVSLAVYYVLVIKYGWQESRVGTILPWLVLVPILIGFTFAFAGIPFYGSLMLWCNNTASYWPDIAVAVAIGMATLLMASLCWDVYVKDSNAAKWRMRSATSSSATSSRGTVSLSTRVFWQSIWYLLSFYLTWPPYLALQYLWAGGQAYNRYGLTLMAATMVPLQGFWNMIVYVRPRYLNRCWESLRGKNGAGVRSSQKNSSSMITSSRFWTWITPSNLMSGDRSSFWRGQGSKKLAATPPTSDEEEQDRSSSNNNNANHAAVVAANKREECKMEESVKSFED